MNKLFTKIAALALGATMAVGVGVAIGSVSKEPLRANAAATDGNECVLWTSGYQASTSYTTSDDGAIKWKNSAGNTYSSPTRIYKNNTFEISIADSTKAASINGVVIVANNADYATDTNSPNSTWTATGTSAGVSTVLSSTTITATTSGTVSKITIKAITNQVRWNSVTVYYAPVGGGPTKLATPHPTYSNGDVSWSAIPNASSYDLTIDGGSAVHNATSPYDVSSLSCPAAHTVTVTAIGNGTTYTDSNPGTVKFAYTDHAGTSSDPYDIVDAKAFIDSLGDSVSENDVYVGGIISQIDSFNDQYSSITYWISDDGTKTNQLEVYSGKGLNNTDFSSKSDIVTGADVTVVGKVKKFNDVYEFDKNNYLVSYTAPAGKLPTPTPTYNLANQEITWVADSNAIRYEAKVDDGNYSTVTSPLSVSSYTSDVMHTLTLKAIGDGTSYTNSDEATCKFALLPSNSENNPYSVTQAFLAVDLNMGISNVYVAGLVSTGGSNLSSGKLNYYISDDGTTTKQLEVYKGLGINGASFTSTDDVKVGDSVKVVGTLKKYNSTYEFEEGSHLVSLTRKFSVTYDANNATSGTVPTDSTKYDNGATVTVLGNTGTLAKTGFTWNGWNTQTDGKGTHYAAGSTFTISANTTLYAEWTTTLDAITSISGTVSANTSQAGTKNWDFSAVTVTGTISGVSNQDVKAYVDLTSSTTIPAAATSSITVSVTATRKSSIPGTNTPLTSDVEGSVTSYDNTAGIPEGDYYMYVMYNSKQYYFAGANTPTANSYGLLDESKLNAVKLNFHLIDDDVWNIDVSDGGTYDGYHLSLSNNSTGLKYSDSSGDAVNMGITKAGSTFNDGFNIQSAASSGRKFAVYTTGPQIRFYASGSYDFTMHLESAKTISGFSVNTEGANKNVLKGTTFDAAAAAAAGFQARLNYTDSTYDDVTSLATWTLDTSTVTENATLTVSYLSYEDVEITGMNIYVVSIVSLSVDATNAKTSGYWTGDSLDTNGLVITGYDSSSNEYSIAIGDCTFSPTTLTIAGNSITITVSYPNESGDPATGTYTVSVSEFAYSKATSINGGDKVIFAYESETVSKYMNGISTSSTKYGTMADYETRPDIAGAMIFDVVAGSVDGSVAFKNGSNYLYWTSGNSLNVNSTLSDNTSWNISFNGGIASIVNVATVDDAKPRYMGYNTSDPRIACYDNNKENIIIWKLNGASGASDAEDFADEFLDIVVDGVCKPNDPATFDENMAYYWEAISEDYALLSDEAKAYIASKSADSSGDSVEDMLYEYQHIYETYGEDLSLANFLGRIEVSKSAIAPKTPTVAVLGDSTNTISIVVIVSIISVSAIGGYFFLRKRREEN